MNRRIVALITAFIILIAPVWFPASVVHAAGPETDAIMEDNAGEPYSDSVIFGDSLDESGDKSESETEPGGVTENELESGDGDGYESVTEETQGEAPEDGLSVGPGLGEGGLGGGETPAENEIFMFKWDREDETYFLEIGEDPTDLPLPTCIEGYIKWWIYEPLEVVWRYDDIDPDTPGRYTITCEIMLKDGYTTSLPLTAELAVIVYDPNGQPAAKANWVYSPLKKNVVPLGMSSNELKAFIRDNLWDTPVDIWTEDGDYCYGELTGWDVSLVDTSKPGVYYPFVIEPPPGIELPAEGVWGAELYVLDPDEVCLFAIDYNYYPGNGSIDIRWLKKVNQPELWLSVDDGGWQKVDRNEYSFGIWEDNLRLDLYSFPYGHVYEFEVRYENGGVSKDSLTMDLTGARPDFHAPGGDRTGGDRGENTLPPVNPDDGTPANPGNGTATPMPGNPSGDTPAPTPTNPDSETPAIPIPSSTHAAQGATDGDTPPGAEETTDAEPAAAITPAPAAFEAQSALPTVVPAENSDERSITVSGTRLAMMIAANPSYVTFFRGELRVSLPALFLEGLDLSPADTFTVTLYQQDERSFTVSFTVRGNDLPDRFAEPFIVSLPWNDGPVSCSQEHGVPIRAELDTGRAAFALYMTGTYVLTKQEQELSAMSFVQNADVPMTNTSVPETDTITNSLTPASPYTDGWARAVMAGMIGLAGAGVFLGFVRKRAVKRP